MCRIVIKRLAQVIALDTNVLVRLITRDDEKQAQRAKAVLDMHADEDGGLFVTDIERDGACS